MSCVFMYECWKSALRARKAVCAWLPNLHVGTLSFIKLWKTKSRIHNSTHHVTCHIKPKSDIHCNRSATSPRPKFITIAKVAEESQLGFAVGRRLVGDWSGTGRRLIGDWSATSLGPLCDLMQLVADPTNRRPVADQSPTK